MVSVPSVSVSRLTSSSTITLDNCSSWVRASSWVCSARELFLLRLLSLLRLLQFVPQLCLRLFVLCQFGFQLAPPFCAFGSFQFSLQRSLCLLIFRQSGLEFTPALGMLGGLA